MNSQDVINILNTIAEQIGVTVDYVVPALAKYKVAEYLTDLGRSVILLIIAYISYRIFRKAMCKYVELTDNREDTDGVEVILIISGIILFVTSLFGFLTLSDSLNIIPWLITPEGSVVNYVLSMIK